ncbi:MAG: hypothetical protein AAF582_00130 [Pseudomonadota bacterium]
MKMMTMFWMTAAWTEILKAPADGAGGGGDDTTGGGGDDTAAGGGGDDTAAGGGGNDTTGGAWHEDARFDDDTKTQLNALGLAVEDPLDAVNSLLKMEKSAKAKLGDNPENLIKRPGEGQDVAEWLRENGDAFGIPSDAEGYEINPPESWPKDQKWDAEFEAEARKIAHDQGLSGKALQAFTDLYAGKMQAMLGTSQEELQRANSVMMQDLRKDFGDQLGNRVQRARQAMDVIAQKAGLDDDGRANLADALSDKVGDAAVIRMFDQVAEALSEDSLVASTFQGGAMTPAEAQAELNKMMEPGSEYQQLQRDKKAGKRGAEYAAAHKRYLELNAIAAGSK